MILAFLVNIFKDHLSIIHTDVSLWHKYQIYEYET